MKNRGLVTYDIRGNAEYFEVAMALDTELNQAAHKQVINVSGSGGIVSGDT